VSHDAQDDGKLQLLLNRLRNAAVVPRTEGETRTETVRRIKQPGRLCAIDEATDLFFRDVLPPHFMGHGVFAFAAGQEALRLFFKDGDRSLCRQFTWDETVLFCDLAGIPTPD